MHSCPKLCGSMYVLNSTFPGARLWIPLQNFLFPFSSRKYEVLLEFCDARKRKSNWFYRNWRRRWRERMNWKGLTLYPSLCLVGAGSDNGLLTFSFPQMNIGQKTLGTMGLKSKNPHSIFPYTPDHLESNLSTGTQQHQRFSSHISNQYSGKMFQIHFLAKNPIKLLNSVSSCLEIIDHWTCLTFHVFHWF